jgi:hypothetical protein
MTSGTDYLLTNYMSVLQSSRNFMISCITAHHCPSPNNTDRSLRAGVSAPKEHWPTMTVMSTSEQHWPTGHMLDRGFTVIPSGYSIGVRYICKGLRLNN